MTDDIEKDEVWHTEDGRIIPVSELSADHARNIIRMLIRRKRKIQAMRVAMEHAEDQFWQDMADDKKWGSN